ncbi:MAG: hypothetical protein IJQ66_03170 [Clostridia bacterium]|nr:hypothetical protein [Clostridia bacterium]
MKKTYASPQFVVHLLGQVNMLVASAFGDNDGRWNEDWDASLGGNYL